MNKKIKTTFLKYFLADIIYEDMQTKYEKYIFLDEIQPFINLYIYPLFSYKIVLTCPWTKYYDMLHTILWHEKHTHVLFEIGNLFYISKGEAIDYINKSNISFKGLKNVSIQSGIDIIKNTDFFDVYSLSHLEEKYGTIY